MQTTSVASVEARLKEPLTYPLDISSDRREELRRLVELLYEERSKFVHTANRNAQASAAVVGSPVAC